MIYAVTSRYTRAAAFRGPKDPSFNGPSTEIYKAGGNFPLPPLSEQKSFIGFREFAARFYLGKSRKVASFLKRVTLVRASVPGTPPRGRASIAI